MTDRELLELAAKAAGMYFDKYQECWYENGEMSRPTWNPLTDDGDALRLAVKLRLILKNRDDLADAYSMEYSEKTLPADPYAATRRAIVRAAADIGRTM